MSSWRFWVSWGALPLWLSAVVLYWSADNALANRVLAGMCDRLRAARVPTRLSQLVPPPIPDSENAAVEYYRALSHLRNRFWREWPRFAYEWGEAMPPAAHEKMESTVAMHQASLSHLLEGAKRPKCQFVFDPRTEFWSDWTLSSNSYDAHRLLAAAARLAFERGDVEGADAFLAAAVLLARAYRGCPDFMPRHISMVCQSDSRRLFESYLAIGGRPGPCMKAALAAMDPEEFYRDFPRVLRSEHVRGLEFFAEVKLGFDWFTGFSDGSYDRTWFIVKWPTWKRERAAFSLEMQELIGLVSKPMNARVWTDPRFDVPVREDIGVCWGSYSYYLDRTVQAAVDWDLMRCAVDGVADRPDRFGTGALKVKEEGDRRVIYSVGPNGVDDGAKKSSDDVAIRLPR